MQGGMKKSWFSINISLYPQIIHDRATVIMEGEYETAPKLSNGTGLNDLDQSTSNNSKTVQNRTIFTMAYQ